MNSLVHSPSAHTHREAEPPVVDLRARAERLALGFREAADRKAEALSAAYGGSIRDRGADALAELAETLFASMATTASAVGTEGEARSAPNQPGETSRD